MTLSWVLGSVTISIIACVFVSDIHTRHSPCDMPLSKHKDNKLWEDNLQPGNDSILQWRRKKHNISLYWQWLKKSDEDKNSDVKMWTKN